MLKSYFITDALKRLSAKNEINDYAVMLKNSDLGLWLLHERLEKIRHDAKENYQSYDYGNGYYYQSMKSINISGYRDTEDRIKQLDLIDRLIELSDKKFKIDIKSFLEGIKYFRNKQKKLKYFIKVIDSVLGFFFYKNTRAHIIY